MKNLQMLFTIISLLAVFSCSNSRRDQPVVYEGTTIPFKKADVEGWRYELVSNTHTFSISFTKGGNAPAIAGPGGVVSWPFYQWKIDEDHCLTLSDDRGLRASYQLISLTSDTVSVWNKIGGEQPEISAITQLPHL